MNKRPLYTGGLVTLHRWIGHFTQVDWSLYTGGLVTLHRWIGHFTRVDWSLYTGGLVTLHRWIGHFTQVGWSLYTGGLVVFPDLSLPLVTIWNRHSRVINCSVRVFFPFKPKLAVN